MASAIPNTTLRQVGEPFTDYWIRLFERKEEYGLTCEAIAALLNTDQGVEYSESKWRKDYAMFSRGRDYERKHSGVIAANRILCLSDFHVPFQLPIETFADYVGKVDTLVLNGDIGDCQAISKFPKAYRVSPMEELIETREYLIALVDYLKPQKIICTYGNHDIRFQNYLAKSLDTDLLELMPQTSLELIFCTGFTHYDKRRMVKTWYEPLKSVFFETDIDYVDNWMTQIGDTIFCHPYAFSSAMMKTADKAMQYFRNEGFSFKTLVMAHTHRIGSYKVGDTMLYEQGCCCDVRKLHYADGKLTPSQKEGFIYFGQDVHGNTIPSSVQLVTLN